MSAGCPDAEKHQGSYLNSRMLLKVIHTDTQTELLKLWDVDLRRKKQY